jgi:hypothetical protein
MGMTNEDLKALRKRVHEAEEIQREISRLKERIGCIERATGGFTFDCDSRGMPLGDSQELKAVILAELKRQRDEQETKLAMM